MMSTDQKLLVTILIKHTNLIMEREAKRESMNYRITFTCAIYYCEKPGTVVVIGKGG